jgi:glutathionyl-hydroquinone reductase
MGQLVDGKWVRGTVGKADEGGRFRRPSSPFRSWITPDGAPGPSGEGGFRAEPGRYHLYVSYACPWAHRTLIFRAIKGLQDLIGVSVVHPMMLENGWSFEEGAGVVPDPIHGARYLHQIYAAADPAFTGKVTVPVLWDRKRGTIVSNESSEIVRMFNSAFDGVGAAPGDYYPEPMREEIEAVNDRVYETFNNGVYRCGFATSQDAYDEAFDALFDTVNWMEERLSRQPYLAGDRPTEADWRAFPTLIRFDPVYHNHFKCNLRRIKDYSALASYTRALYQAPGVVETVNMDHIKRHYYGSHTHINPTGIVPRGPAIDYGAPHDRAPVELGA